jgi:hypothetical protein
MRIHSGQDLLDLPSDIGLPGERGLQMGREKVIIEKQDAGPCDDDI